MSEGAEGERSALSSNWVSTEIRRYQASSVLQYGYVMSNNVAFSEHVYCDECSFHFLP